MFWWHCQSHVGDVALQPAQRAERGRGRRLCGRHGAADLRAGPGDRPGDPRAQGRGHVPGHAHGPAHARSSAHRGPQHHQEREEEWEYVVPGAQLSGDPLERETMSELINNTFILIGFGGFGGC